MTGRKARKSSPRCRLRARNRRCPVSMLMVPNTTRRAFRPLRSTRRRCPRWPQAARSGGNSSRSVSSSKSLTQRGGKSSICQRMRTFFSALRVRRQDVAGPLPDVVQVAKVAADRGRGQAGAAVACQVLAQQGDRPAPGLVAELVRPLRQTIPEEGLEFFGPHGRVVAAALVEQAFRVPGAGIAGQPVMDAGTAEAEE